MLRRVGNKTKLIPKLLNAFPDNIATFIDMFMGSGSVSLAMIDKAKYIIANDKEQDIFNLFMVVRNQKDELIQAVEMMPQHESLLKYWKTNNEADPVWQAARFLMLSNFGMYGNPNTLSITNDNTKKILIANINNILPKIQNIQFMSCDFRDVLNKISFRHGEKTKSNSFIYADPPYLDRMNNYKNGFTLQDTQDLFKLLIESGIRFAISEFPHPKVLELANDYKLNIIDLGERRNIHNRKREILITNYEQSSNYGQTTLIKAA